MGFITMKSGICALASLSLQPLDHPPGSLAINDFHGATSKISGYLGAVPYPIPIPALLS